MDIDQISVLIVEDNQSAALLLQTVLEDIGVRQVQVVHDGESALAKLAVAEPGVDIVLCDWRMPKMTGIELLQKVRAVHNEMPFMMISANSDESSLQEARSEGVNAYLVKPYVPEDVEKKLKYLVLQM